MAASILRLIAVFGILISSIFLVSAYDMIYNSHTGKLDYINVFNLTNSHLLNALNITNLDGFTNKILSNVANVTDAAKVGACSANNYASATTTSGVTCSIPPGIDDAHLHKSSNVTINNNVAMLTYNLTWTSTNQIYDNTTCVLIKGTTSTLSIC